MVKIAINGFGRIGRLVFRAAFQRKNAEIVAINDLADAKTLAHLLQFDSVYGKFPEKISAGEGFLMVGSKKIHVSSEPDPEKLPWKQLGVEVVLECTGVFLKKSDAEKHLKAGARKVILSAPPKDAEIKQVVFGVNHNPLKDGDIILSCASCTTNSLVPAAYILDKEFGIESGFLTTIHAVTLDQNLLDAPHKDLRRARSAMVNIIPTKTGAAKSVGDVLTQLKGKLDGIAVRVPVPVGSLSDFVVQLKRNVTVEEINSAFRKYAQGELKGVLEYSEDELVSTDIIGNFHSSIFDSKKTMANKNMAKILCWYDNEFGFSNRMLDLAEFISKR